MKRSLATLLIMALFGFGLTIGFSQKAIHQKRHDILLRYESPKSAMDPDLIKMLAGEFKGLAADYLLLEVGSFLGSNQPADEQDWHNVYLTLKQALVLDPYFQQTYIYAQGNLPWQGKMPDKATEILEISREHRPWDYFPGQYIAFNSYYFFNDYAKASEAFLEAARIKGAPEILTALGARFAVKGQRTVAAIAMLQDKLRDEGIKPYQERAIRKRLKALQGILLIEQAINIYREKFDANPSTLEALVSQGILSRLPDNPYRNRFYYQADSGEVAFDKIKTKTATTPYQ